FRRAVARKDDLLPLLVDRVERMEELFLRPLFSGEELDVVDEQHVDAPVALAELLALLRADRVDELVREFLARCVRDALLGVPADDSVPDRVHEMRLAQAGSAIDEQRVVRMPGSL